jgi:hypothetical protein
MRNQLGEVVTNGWSPSKGIRLPLIWYCCRAETGRFCRLQNKSFGWNGIQKYRTKLGIWLVKLKGFLRNA